MPSAKSTKKTNTGVSGVKMLITAASLAATIGGWALISDQPVEPVQPPALVQATEPALSIKFPPLPTLVPAIALPAQILTVNNPRPVVSAAQSAQPAAPSGLVLRDVSAPFARASAPAAHAAPPPVAHTGSSR